MVKKFVADPELLAQLEVRLDGKEVIIKCPDEEEAASLHEYLTNTLAPHKESSV